MKNILLIGGLLLGFSGFTEAQSGKERLEAAEEKAAEERERSLGGKRTTNYLKSNPADQSADEADTTANEQMQNDSQVGNQENTQSQETGESGQPVGGDNDSNGLMNANEDEPDPSNSIGNTPDEEKTSTPSVIQQTSSESGSPAVLSNDDGTGRDGTGNVQRAKPNMVGSPVPANMDLADKNVNPSNSETGTQIKQQEEQPARTGPNREDAGAQGKGDAQAEQKGQGNQASQGQGNTQASQKQGAQANQNNDQVKEKEDSKEAKREARKERREERRKNRDKDS